MEDSGLLKKSRHPVLEEFLIQYPVCDEDAGQRAFYVYQDLTEVKGWWSTELTYSDSCELPYITGHPSKSEPRQIVIPVGVEDRVSLNEMHSYFSHIFIEDEPVESMTIAVNDVDTTTVYYKITKGLSPPDSPEAVAKSRTAKSQKLNRKRQLIAACVRQASERLSKETL
ncbi:hypothetical protein Btru_072709 [Bulinus truncatus]|nr:hypothetical protein Btru_072709 [Bulinus truncatus]